jgi:DNA-directed RNA polymerase subunit RPC12/RpoP
VEIIKFKCVNCNCSIGAPEKYAGKQVRCPKCKSPVRVPEFTGKTRPQESKIIKFRCPNCNQKIGVSSDYAGKRVRCSKCKNPLRVPQAPSSTVRDEAAVLRAGYEQPPAEEGFQRGLANLDELLLAEEKAPSVERQMEQGPSDYGAGVSKLSSGRLPTSGLSAERQVREAPSRKRYLTIFVTCGVLLLVLLAGVIVWRFISSSDTSKSEIVSGFPESQKFAEDYIDLLNKGEKDKAVKLLVPGLQNDADKKELEKLSKYLSRGNIEQLRCSAKNFERHPEGNQFYFYYIFLYENKYHSIILSVSEIGKEMKIDGIAAQESFGYEISIGPRSYAELQTIAFAATVSKFKSIFAKFFCSIMAVMLVVFFVQLVSIWIVFEKAGQHGWAVLVPGYNMWVLAEIGDKPGWMGLLMFFSGFIPYIGLVVGLVLSFVISIGVAKAFGRGAGFGVGLALLPFVFYPIIAFSNN